MFAAMIKEKREAAGRAIEAAKALGKRMREEPTKATELNEQFSKAHSDAMSLLGECEQLEKEQDLSRAETFMSQPGPESKTVHRAVDGASSKPNRERAEAHHASMIEFFRSGDLGKAKEKLSMFGPEEIHALLGTQGDLGGFLSSDEFRGQVQKDLPGFAVMRGICRVERTGRPALVLPTVQSATNSPDIYASGYTGAWKTQGYVTGGTAPTVQNKPVFGQERIPVHDWQPDAVEVTVDLLEDSEADLNGILAETFAETMALDEDSACISGTGVGQPEGVLSGGSPNPGTDLGTATTFTYAGLLALYTALPAQYRQNGRFLMNSGTYGKLLALESTGGMPLFPPNSLPGTLFTKPIVFSEFMPSVATTAKTIVFGDFQRGYVIVDRSELRIQRLAERYAPNIGFLPIKRTGGQVVRPRALRIGKHAA